MSYIYLDPNVRDILVSPSTDMMLKDSKVIVQSVWRLMNTEEGEIPNFRNYGLDVKQFGQYPLTDGTIGTIYDYVKGRIEAFEVRTEVIRADVDVDFAEGLVSMAFYIRIIETAEVVKLPIWTVKVAGS